jgi:hypothetical protein
LSLIAVIAPAAANAAVAFSASAVATAATATAAAAAAATGVELIVVNCRRKRHKQHHQQLTNGSTILFTTWTSSDCTIQPQTVTIQSVEKQSGLRLYIIWYIHPVGSDCNYIQRGLRL